MRKLLRSDCIGIGHEERDRKDDPSGLLETPCKGLIGICQTGLLRQRASKGRRNRSIGRGGGKKLFQCRERRAGFGFRVDDVESDDFCPGGGDSLDQLRLLIPRPGPAAHLLQTLLVDQNQRDLAPDGTFSSDAELNIKEGMI